MLYLASKSPRRKDILNMLNIHFEIIDNSFDESILNNDDPKSFVIESAYSKALDSSSDINSGIVLGADTIVVLDGEIFGKPDDYKHAREMLIKLRNKKHSVYTALAFIELKNGEMKKIIKDYEMTDVYFSDFSEEILDNYLSQNTYKDKAGSYGIQDSGCTLIKKIDGCFYNVVGLPVNLFTCLYTEVKQY